MISVMDLTAFADNPYFSAGFGLLGVTFGLAVLRRSLLTSSELLKRRLLVTLEIPSKDKSYIWFLQWMAAHATKQRHHSPFLSVETMYVQRNNGSVVTQFSLVPGRGRHFFKYQNAWFMVERQRDSRLMDHTTGTPWETVTMTTLARDKAMFSEILMHARHYALAQQEGKTVIFTSYGPEWRPFGSPRKRRMLDSVVLGEGIAERIVADVREFLRNGKWYNDRGIPYRRGYLLYGPPGTGKSSFIQALAGELEYNICIMNLAERGLTDDRLNHLLSNTPEKSILLLEDVDAAFTSQDGHDSRREGFSSSVTFSGLLNALDGVAAAEERIVFMTTNHLDRLDAALIRPGRADVHEFVGYATPEQIKRMFTRFYPAQKDLADAFIHHVTAHAKPVSTAALQGLFVAYKTDASLAMENIHLLFTPSHVLDQ
jgi:chaperone BCS1